MKKKKDSIYSAELIVDDLADGLPDAAAPTLSHFDKAGQASMVDVSAKAAGRREAVAAVASIATPCSTTFTCTSTKLNASGWHIGIRLAVCFAA